MAQIVTTKEQSEKLISLGLNINTADMYWVTTHELKLYVKTNVVDRLGYTPAWSLSALMGLIPYPSLHNLFNDKWRCDIHYEDGDVRKFGEDTDSPINAAFEMVCYLLENKMI